MAAYIVGMITGAVCLVFPLVYLMHIDRCVVKILDSGAGTVDQFLAHSQHSLAYGTAIIGAVVLLASTLLMALAGMTQIKARRKAMAGPGPTPEPSPPDSPDISPPV
jgi:hypothetical protein